MSLYRGSVVVRMSAAGSIAGAEMDIDMNDSEMRRRELLRQTRKLYDERREVPAVHPRYGSVYHSLYYDEEEERTSLAGSFYISLVIGILCFAGFVYMDQSKVSVAEVDSTAIVNQIEKNVDADTIKEVWKNL